MLKRVATEFTGERDVGIEKEITYLSRLVRNVGYRNVYFERLEDLYQEIPADVRAQGSLYRGIAIERGDFYKLMSNQSFSTKDWSENDRGEIESWSTSIFQAMRFAGNETYSERPAGVVLQSSVANLQQDIIMDMSGEAWDFVVNKRFKQYAESLEDPEDQEFWLNEIKVFTGFREEEEVMVWHQGSRKYTLCEDVVRVVTYNNDILQYNEEERIKFFLAVDEATQKKLDPLAKQGKLPQQTMFRCDGEGELSIDTFRWIG